MPDRVRILVEIANERLRQIRVEGYTPAHDDRHDRGELYRAAKCYARHGTALALETQRGWPHQWPWEPASWKPVDRRRNLVRAAALCVAERQRLERQGRDIPAQVNLLFAQIVVDLEALEQAAA